ncbi:xenotropic and polytropic retrovirus receptor 1 homolog [Ceratitis capitata]|uniref:xenotropic and polytropic retrovirus receptor 1 homolog n=1 Tax=Ceratitis capitata TaxID=7213 RepID=UPI000329B12D|nr:xenotropic and polytropic retrovirus receptor 1 homolog [Ceratitis capitata]
MKFQQNLQSHLTPEWRTQYIDYAHLRQMILDAIEFAPSENSAEQRVYFMQFQQNFHELCNKELEKINMFYEAKLAEINHKFTILRDELKLVGEMADTNLLARPSIRISNRQYQQTLDMTKILTRHATHDFKAAFSELYLNTILLRNYQILNYTGFRKILKKYDKRIRGRAGHDYMLANVEKASFHKSHETKVLLKKIEDIMTYNLEHGNRHKAMERLRVPPLADKSHPWTSFRTGFSLGALIVLGIMVVLSFTMKVIDVDVVTCVLLFRGPFTMILFLGLLSLNVYIWRYVGINHVLIFELNPRNYLAAVQILEIAVVFGCILSLLTLAFLHSQYLGMPPYVFPLAMPLIMIAFLINPIRIFHYQSRMWLLRYLGRIVCAPFFSVVFVDFWLADQFNSLVALFVDYSHIICYYTTPFDWYHAKEPTTCATNQRYTALIRVLPAWFRFAQCLRRYYDDSKRPKKYLINAGKYATTFFVVFFDFMMKYQEASYSSRFKNPFIWLMLIAAIASSTYGLAWDFLNDWGLFRRDCGEHKYLRSQILYRPSFYYFLIVENFLLRFLWAYVFILDETNVVTRRIMAPIADILEAIRRFLWNFIRLENEHLNNCGKFRAVRDISITVIEKPFRGSLISLSDPSAKPTNNWRKGAKLNVTNNPKKATMLV